jgi:uncharacterized protein (DUF1501 family)
MKNVILSNPAGASCALLFSVRRLPGRSRCFSRRHFSQLDAMAADSLIQTATGKDGHILVVLQLAGGNDGLNMVVPFADVAYYRARPKLALPTGTILRLNSYAGLNPKLIGLIIALR